MKPKLKTGLIAAVPMALFLALGMWLGRRLELQGWGFQLFWIGFALLGAMVGGVLFWFMNRRRSGREAPVRPPLEEDLNARLSEVRKRLAAAQRPGLEKLPTVLIFGPPHSAKSSSVVGSEIAAEQLAGDAPRGGELPPTSSMNAWYSDGAILLEAGDGLREEPSLWSLLLQKIRPRKLLAAILTRRAQAPRSAVVCFSCEEFRTSGAVESARNWGRALRQNLLEMCHKLGVQIPVYVLFTKADVIPSFSDYCSTFREGGSGQVLGATLSPPSDPHAATFSDRQSRILGRALQDLVRSLALKRLKYLNLDLEPKQATTAYEFPREFKKLAPAVTQFLVELCKPSQLQVSPFLRGFYFVGRQELAVEGGYQAPKEEVSGVVPVGGATEVFDPRQMGSAPIPPAYAETRRPGVRHRWLFLPRVVRDIVLRDEIATGMMRRGKRVGFGRRLLLGGVSLVALSLTLGLFGDFSYNRDLQTRVAGVLGRLESTTADTEVAERLRRLEAVRVEADTLGRHQARSGVFRSAKWLGLYSGSRLFPKVIQEYSNTFHPLLLGPALDSIGADLGRLPPRPTDDSDYSSTYNKLRAYLMSTEHRDRAEARFLSRWLSEHWPLGRTEEEFQLAAGQFSFFGGTLLGLEDELYRPRSANEPIVQHARSVLGQMGQANHIYEFLKNEANDTLGAYRFDEILDFRQTVVRVREAVPGAFSPQGWQYMEARLSDEENLLETEDWVLGPTQIQPGDELAGKIDALYKDEYRRLWRDVLEGASIAPFADLSDAAEKLDELTRDGPSGSPLTELLREVWERTVAVLPEDQSGEYQSLNAVFSRDSVGEPLELTPEVEEYFVRMDALKSSMETLAGPLGMGSIDDANSIAAQGILADAETAADDLWRNMIRGQTQEGRRVAERLDDVFRLPIRQAGALIGAVEPNVLNQIGREFCTDYGRRVGSKFPFNRGSEEEPSLEDLAYVFRPGQSLLWDLLDDLEPYIDELGTGFEQARRSPEPINPAFLAFLSQAHEFSLSIVGSEGELRELELALGPRLDESSPGVESITLRIDDTAHTCTDRICSDYPFSWTGSSDSRMEMTAQVDGRNVRVAGPFRDRWAVFRFFSQTVEWRDIGGNQHAVRWRVPGTQKYVEAVVHGSQSTILSPRAMDGLGCVQQVVRRP
ncbi:ImcF-related family protein [Gemmatimonadota bacterium]